MHGHENRWFNLWSCLESLIGGCENAIQRRLLYGCIGKGRLASSHDDDFGTKIERMDRHQRRRGWRSKDVADAQDLISLRIERLVQTLTRDYQVVLVASAGEDFDESYGDISIWPGGFASNYDMITIGAVQSEEGDDFGRRFAWSAGGDAVSVSGPGNGLCAYLDDELYTVEGASFANAVVSGLVAYFLSIQALQRHFQNQPNLPAAVRDYVVSMSSRRYEAQRSVWNGLDYTNPSIMFDDPQTPNSKNPNAPTTTYPVWKGIPLL